MRYKQLINKDSGKITYSLKFGYAMRRRLFPADCVKADKACSGYFSTLALPFQLRLDSEKNSW